MVVNLSLSIRVAVNAEALNMAEAVGNYTRHRKAPVVIPAGGGYSVVYVPAVSGESLAHNYQVLLAQIAKSRQLPVTKMDELGYFLKFADDNIIERLYKDDLERVRIGVKAGKEQIKIPKILGELNPPDIERLFLKASVVADVGGFLYAVKNRSIKRTSAVRFSYMIPTLDSIERGGAAIIPQLHSRYSPPEYAKDFQKLFYIESGSALYTFTAELRASDIGVLNYSSEESRLLDDWESRVKVAVEALIALVDGMMFGAKRSRYNPLWDVRSIIVAVSSGPVEFIVSPGITRDYIKKTYERAQWLTSSIDGETVSIYVFDGEGLKKPEQSQEQSQKAEERKIIFKEVSSHTEALAKAKDKLLEKLKEEQQHKKR